MSYFDHFAQTKTTPVGRWLLAKTKVHQVRLIETLLPDRQSAILEIGPGKGELAAALRRAGYRCYTGVEPNEQMRAALHRQGINTRDYLVPYLEEPDAAYDALVIDSVFEHLHGTKEAQLFLNEARRVLRPGGYLLIAAPDYLHWREDFFNCDYTHSNITTVRRAIQLFTNHGFHPVRWLYLSGPFTGWAATLVSLMARAMGPLANSNGLDQKLYKLKLSLLRQFLIAGFRQGSQ